MSSNWIIRHKWTEKKNKSTERRKEKKKDPMVDLSVERKVGCISGSVKK